MIRAIASFELRYHLKTPLFWILFAVYFGLAAVSVSSDAVSLGGALGTVHRNSPYVIMTVLLLMTLFGPLTTTAFVASSILRDFEQHTDSMFFSFPIRKWQYVGGRFCGSFAAGVLVYFGIVAAIMLGSVLPWVPKAELGPLQLFPYVYSLGVLVIPNLLLFGAIFFAVAALTRSAMATYASVVAMYVLYAVSGFMAGDIEREWLAGLLDPFGLQAYMVAVRYWTVFEKNTEVIAVSGIFLWNRVLWLSVAAAVLAAAYAGFRMTTASRAWRRKPPEPAEEPALREVPPSLPLVRQTFTRAAALAQFASSVRMQVVGTVKSIPFAIMVLCGVFGVWGAASDSGLLDPPYPVTSEMVDAILAGFGIFALLAAAFYAGDVVWRERTLKIHEVTDSMPVATSLQWGSKLASLMVVILLTLAAAVLTTLAVQTSRGYYNYELDLYLKAVIAQVGMWLGLIAGLAFLLQVFFNHKLAAFVGMAVFFVLDLALPLLGFEHVLYRFAALPPLEYSDMNGYGHFVAPLFWGNLYWILFVALMLAIGHLFWVRGTEAGFRQRRSIARQRFSKRAATAIALLFAGFASTGCYIYYNTNILNTWLSRKNLESRAATAEKRYKRYEGIPQPRVVDAIVNVDLHPERRAVYVDGSYVAVNRSGKPIRDVHVSWAAGVLTAMDVALPGATLRVDDRELGYRIYTLPRPLAPGASLKMSFRTAFEARGFPAGPANNRVVENGTFIHNFDYLPHFGYTARNELDDDNERRKYGLPPVQRMKKQDDPAALQENKLGRGSDWISLETTVSTSPGQIAIAPGYLQREWTSNGRRYFHYKTTSPIPGFWAYLSARYAVKRDSWTSADGQKVAIEIYYHPEHSYNVERMVYAVKKSLDYFTANFSPYQHRQVRIVEFPGYARFAQALPNTIPFSEKVGFISDLRNESAIDYVFYIVAHEVAHQWWGHQVVGANVQGLTVLTETLAQYSALMVMKKEYPEARLRRVLRNELDRYLDGRSRETIGEMPLMLVEQQDYIHYHKGSMAMYALQDVIGEERVNRALSKFIRDRAFSGAPYPTARELVQYMRAEAGPEHQELITDLFERIVLYDNQTRDVTATRRPDGRYAVKLTVTATKLRADAKGEERLVPLDDWMDLAIFADSPTDDFGKLLFFEKRRITKPVETFEIVVNEKPARAGIDPFNKLIDRNPRDNSKTF